MRHGFAAVGGQCLVNNSGLVDFDRSMKTYTIYESKSQLSALVKEVTGDF